MESTARRQSKIFNPSAPASAKKTAGKTAKKTTGKKAAGKSSAKKSSSKKPKIDKRDNKSSWVAGFILYPESACLDADPNISKQQAIYDAIANRNRHDLTGFISPLHDHDAQRSDYRVGEDDNNKKVDETSGVLYAGAMTMFAHLAGAAVSILGDDEKKASKSSPQQYDSPLMHYDLVRRTLAFLEKDRRFIYDRKTITTTMAYYIERFVDEVLIPAPESAWKQLQKEAPDFFRSPESRILEVEEETSDGKKKKKKILPGEKDYYDPDPEGRNWAHVPDYKTFQAHKYKKPHYHVVLIHTGYKAISKKGWQHRGLNYWGDLSGGRVELVVSDVKNMYEYMTHESIKAKVEYKHVYDSDDLLELPGFTLEDYYDISKEYRRTILGLAQDFGQVIYDVKKYGFSVYYDNNFDDSIPTEHSKSRPYEQYTYIKSSEDLEWYWGHSNLIDVCDNLTTIIDNIEDIISGKHAADSKKKNEKIADFRNELEKISSGSLDLPTNEFYKEESRRYEEDLRKHFEASIEEFKLEIKTDAVIVKGDVSVLESDKKRLKKIKKLVKEHQWPDEVELRRSILAYRNLYKDIYDTQQKLEREIIKIREDNNL